MEKTDKSDFEHWLKHPITKKLFLILQEEDEQLKETMLNPEIIFSKDALRSQAYFVGLREVIYKILNLDASVFIEEETEDEKTNSSW